MKILKLDEWYKFYPDKSYEENEKIYRKKLQTDYVAHYFTSGKKYVLIISCSEGNKLENQTFYQINLGIINREDILETEVSQKISSFLSKMGTLYDGKIQYIHLVCEESKTDLSPNLYHKYEYLINAKKYNL